jgi:hypothetical protein
MLTIFGERENHGYHLRGTRVPLADAMVRLDDCDADDRPGDDTLAAMDVRDIAVRCGVDPEAFAEGVRRSVRQWRVSPSRSFLRALDNDGAGAGAQAFGNIRQQSAMLLAAAEAGFLDGSRDGHLRAVLGDDGKRVMVTSDAPAVTLTEDGKDVFSRVLRAMSLYEARNAALVRTGRVKRPRALFRGMRGIDLPKVDVTHGEGEPYEVRSCRVTAARLGALLSSPLAESCGSSIVSVTSNRTVAEFFTRREGFVVEIDPDEVGIVSGWAVDGDLDGKDAVSARHEREWIVRLPRDLVPSPGQATIHDRTWLTAMAAPEAIAMVEHYDVAEFDLEGRHVRVSWLYNGSGVGGSLRFAVDGGYPETRADIRRRLGFDPLPGPDRHALVSGLRFRSADPVLRSNRDWPVLTPDGFLPETPGCGPSR